MQSIGIDDILDMESRKRAAFINCLSGAKATNLIGTQDKQGRTNLSIMSSAFHVGATPPLMGLIIRPDPVPRHTLHNILETGYYTLNHVNQDILSAAHQTSARYDKDESEFGATGLTSQFVANIPAPFVAESAIKLGLKLVHHQELAVNKTHLVIGEIQTVLLPEDAVADDGHLAITEHGSVAVTGLDTYHELQPIARFKYAKVGQPVELLGE
ncbi:flavin reductase family protein [Halioxenophilus aromaticivorans]|uniref:Flavin reductase n=1 Tax=Halioxenophilus aromaticivorans TaxID=1306992 RepID=A0AAV3U2V7_9ALTE